MERYVFFNNANLCTPKKLAKNNDHTASVVAHGSRARAHAHPGRSCDSFNQLAKKLVTCLAASLAKAPKRRRLE